MVTPLPSSHWPLLWWMPPPPPSSWLFWWIPPSPPIAVIIAAMVSAPHHSGSSSPTAVFPTVVVGWPVLPPQPLSLGLWWVGQSRHHCHRPQGCGVGQSCPHSHPHSCSGLVSPALVAVVPMVGRSPKIDLLHSNFIVNYWDQDGLCLFFFFRMPDMNYLCLYAVLF